MSWALGELVVMMSEFALAGMIDNREVGRLYSIMPRFNGEIIPQKAFGSSGVIG